MRISGFSSLFSAIAVLLCPATAVLKVLRSLGKARKSQKSSLISKEKVNKVSAQTSTLHDSFLFNELPGFWHLFVNHSFAFELLPGL